MNEILIGLVAGAIISWVLSHIYYRKQNKQGDQALEVLVGLITNLSPAIQSDGKVELAVTRDRKGRIRNVLVKQLLQSTIRPTDSLDIKVIRSDPGSTPPAGP